MNQVKEVAQLKKQKLPLTTLQHRRLKRYAIMTVDKLEKLVENNKDKAITSVRYFCKASELFVVLDSAHKNLELKRTRGKFVQVFINIFMWI